VLDLLNKLQFKSADGK